MSKLDLKPIPFIQGSMKYGGTPEENVANYIKMQNLIQSNMNNKYAGGGKYKSKKNKYIKMNGGSAKFEVPQFSINNSLNNSPQNVNTSSVLLNKLYINSVNNSKYDCYATNSCSSKAPMKGGVKKTKRYYSTVKKSYKYKIPKKYRHIMSKKISKRIHNKINNKSKHSKHRKSISKNTKKIRIIGGGCNCGNNILLSGGSNKKCKCMNWLKLWKK